MPRQALPPRILIVMADQWPRALLRAALLEAGYDAIGARTAAEALAQPVTDPERGPVRLVVMDQDALEPETDLTRELGARFRGATLALIAHAGGPPSTGDWNQVIHRPASIGEIVAVVQGLLPLSEAGTGSIE